MQIDDLLNSSFNVELNTDLGLLLAGLKGFYKLQQLDNRKFFSKNLHGEWDKKFVFPKNDCSLINNAIFVPWKDGAITLVDASPNQRNYAIVSAPFGGCYMGAIIQYPKDVSTINYICATHIHYDSKLADCGKFVQWWIDRNYPYASDDVKTKNKYIHLLFRPNYTCKQAYLKQYRNHIDKIDQADLALSQKFKQNSFYGKKLKVKYTVAGVIRVQHHIISLCNLLLKYGFIQGEMISTITAYIVGRSIINLPITLSYNSNNLYQEIINENLDINSFYNLNDDFRQLYKPSEFIISNAEEKHYQITANGFITASVLNFSGAS